MQSILIKTISTILFTVVAQITYGFVLSTLWEWFIVETFNCLSLSIPAAIGIHLISTYLIFNPSIQDQKHNFEEIMIHSASLLLGKSVTVLIIGYIIKGFL